ncbi:MAG: hypothetical protein V5A24_00470 [Haloarculaceae archaeon]
MGSSQGRSRRTKVERVMDEYDLQGLESTLVSRWTGDGEDRWSLRDLADYVNERLVEAALLEAGEQPLDGEVENYYRLLEDEDVSAGARTEARSQIERAGVDVDELQRDFVSHQAVHTYLTDRQEVSYEGASAAERLESARDTVSRLGSRTETIAENTVGGLHNAGLLDIGEFSVMTSVAVVCEECGSRYDFDTLIQQGGCDCRNDDS